MPRLAPDREEPLTRLHNILGITQQGEASQRRWIMMYILCLSRQTPEDGNAA